MKDWKYFLVLLIFTGCEASLEPESRVRVPIADIHWTQTTGPVWVNSDTGNLPDSTNCSHDIVFLPTAVLFYDDLGERDMEGALKCLWEESIVSLDRIPMDRIERTLFNQMTAEQSEREFPDPRLFYAFKSRDSLWINQFDAVTIEHAGPGGDWTVQIDTDYPYSGNVSLITEGPSPQEWTLAFRQPGWTDNRPDPAASYRWRTNRKISVELAGEYLYPEIKNGYAYITRRWEPGDILKINFPMAVRRLLWTDEMDSRYQRMSLEYGPVVLARKENPEEESPLPDHGNLLKQKNDAQEDEWVWTIGRQNYVFKRVADFTEEEKAITSWITGFTK